MVSVVGYVVKFVEFPGLARFVSAIFTLTSYFVWLNIHFALYIFYIWNTEFFLIFRDEFSDLHKIEKLCPESMSPEIW